MNKISLLSLWLRKKRIDLVSFYLTGDILDLGCGPLAILRNSSRRIKKYVGIEYDTSLVKELNKKKYDNAKFFQRDLDTDDLNLEMKFDFILLTAVIEHIFNQKHLFKECLKYLKPGG